jgi:glycosyltransferase involved in cell wall biosynthesis
MTQITVVIPLYNESSLVEELIKRIKLNIRKITEDFEIVIVDDGSEDTTWELIEAAATSEKRIKGIKFSRNFGHHYAITAGLFQANGEWVVVMDGDLQDRPEVIPELYERAQLGFDIVFVSRTNRREKLYYRISQKIFYLILNILSGVDFDSKQANFSIINRKVVEAFKIFPENARFYASTVKWLGFNRTHILAEHGQRFSGKPAYTIRKRLKLATDVILSFSERPLKFVISLGFTMSLLAFIFTLWVVYKSITIGFVVMGWASVISAIIFSTGIILVVVGIVGIYIGEIHKQVKNRPLYIISKTT